MDEQAERSALARSIAAQLGETQSAPVYQIRLALKLLGHERILALVEEALSIEQNGGMRTSDGKRRRTPGGVFFHLLRTAATADQRAQLFATDDERPAKRKYTKRAAKKAAQ